MKGLRRLLVARGRARAGEDTRNLSGDRFVEWSFVAGRLGVLVSPGSRVLDFGAGPGFLSLVAGCLGASVLAIDRLDRRPLMPYPGMQRRQVDLLDLDGAGQFEVVVNCSTVEHVGLAGRYGSKDLPDGDLQAMSRLRGLLVPDGRMILTIPVGRDAVFPPLHRVYGPQRLPRLLSGYRVLESAFVRNADCVAWSSCDEEVALQEMCGPGYYALGMFVLAPED